jgi:hypothetical protein
MDEEERERRERAALPLRTAERYACSTEWWSEIELLGSGCAWATWAVAGLLLVAAVAFVVWVVLRVT